MLLAAIAAVVLAAVAPALAASWSPTDSAKGTFGKGNSGKNKDFSGLVDIGGGREDVFGVPRQGLSHPLSIRSR